MGKSNVPDRIPETNMPHDVNQLASFLAQVKEGQMGAGLVLNRFTLEGIIVALEDRARFREALNILGPALKDAIGWFGQYAGNHDDKVAARQKAIDDPKQRFPGETVKSLTEARDDAARKAQTNRNRVKRLTQALDVAEAVEAGGTKPKHVPPADVAAGLNPGDIANAHGAIEGTPSALGRQLITVGIVWVTQAQADAAEKFGWSRRDVETPFPEDRGLVQIERNWATAEPYLYPEGRP